MNRERPSAVASDRLDRNRLARALIRPLPYGLGSVLFKCLLGNPLGQKLFAGKLRPLRRVRQSLGLPVLTSQQAARYLMVNYTIYWRLHALMRLSEKDFHKVFTVEGEEHLKRYYGERGIVYCNSHYGAGKLAPALAARMGYDLYSVDRVDVFSDLPKPEGCGTIESIELGKKQGEDFHLKAMFRMKKALKKKALMHVAADGYRGAAGAFFTFLGKPRQLPQSFADFAIATDSVVLPVISKLYEDGHIHLIIAEAIDPRELTGTDEEKKHQIIEHYLKWLQTHWLEGTEFVFKNDLALYNQLEGQPDSAAEARMVSA